MNEFFAMGGYAAYVWPAYGLAAVILIGVWIASARSLKARQAEADAAEVAHPRREPR